MKSSAVLSFFIPLSVAALLAWGISYLSGFSFWLAFGIAIIAVLINSFILAVEDNEPGGFNNPHPPQEPKVPSANPNDSSRNA